MRFPIDALFLKTAQDKAVASSPDSASGGVVVKLVERLEPFRFAWAWGADMVIELPAGAIKRGRVKLFSHLTLSKSDRLA